MLTVYIGICMHGYFEGMKCKVFLYQENMYARFCGWKFYYLLYPELILIRNATSVEWITIVVTGGFALVNNNKITILVNEAELGSLCLG